MPRDELGDFIVRDKRDELSNRFVRIGVTHPFEYVVSHGADGEGCRLDDELSLHVHQDSVCLVLRQGVDKGAPSIVQSVLTHGPYLLHLVGRACRSEDQPKGGASNDNATSIGGSGRATQGMRRSRRRPDACRLDPVHPFHHAAAVRHHVAYLDGPQLGGGIGVAECFPST